MTEVLFGQKDKLEREEEELEEEEQESHEKPGRSCLAMA